VSAVRMAGKHSDQAGGLPYPVYAASKTSYQNRPELVPQAEVAHKLHIVVFRIQDDPCRLSGVPAGLVACTGRSGWMAA
jgi:hypothetical protein